MNKKHPTNKTYLLSIICCFLLIYLRIYIYILINTKLFMQFLPSYYCLVAKLSPILLRPQYLHLFFFLLLTPFCFFFFKIFSKDMIFNGCFSVLCKYSIHISAVISCVTLSKSLNLFVSVFSFV